MADFPSPVSQFLECSQYLGPAPTNRLFSCQRSSGIRSNRIQNQVSVVMHTVSPSLSYLNWSNHWSIGSFNCKRIRIAE